MANGVKKIKDKEVFLFNVITGQLDLALKFNAKRLITSDKNIYDRPNMIVDPVTEELVPCDALPITDDEGNMILADDFNNIDPEDVEE